MKQLTILAFIACISAVSSAQRPVATYYDWNHIHPHEQYSVNSAGQKTGPYKEFDEKGVVIREYNYLNGLTNGLCVDYVATEGNQRVVKTKSSYIADKLDGYYVEFCHEDGYKTKAQEGHYKNGIKTSLWKEWWCTEIYDKTYFNILNSIGSYKDGMSDGSWTFYQNNGKLESYGNFSNGLKTGEWKAFSESGSLIAKGSYQNGKETGIWSYYETDDSTKLLGSIDYTSGNGVKTGPWTIYYDKNSKETKYKKECAYYRKITFDNAGHPTQEQVHEYYISGEKCWEGYLLSVYPDVFNPKGTMKYYYKNGKVYKEYDFDKKTYTEYYESGKLGAEAGLDGVDISGKCKIYYESGGVKSEGAYAKGKTEGSWKYYSEKGKLSSEDNYKSGDKINSIQYDDLGEITGADVLNDERMNNHIDKEHILLAKIGQMLYFIESGNVGKTKFNFDLLKASPNAESLFYKFDGQRNMDGNLIDPVLAKYDSRVKPARDLFLQYSGSMFGDNHINDRIEAEKKIINILTQIIG